MSNENFQILSSAVWQPGWATTVKLYSLHSPISDICENISLLKTWWMKYRVFDSIHFPLEISLLFYVERLKDWLQQLK